MNNAAYTSEAKSWWQRNSCGMKCSWNEFSIIWIAALNSPDVAAPSASTNKQSTAIAQIADEMAQFCRRHELTVGSKHIELIQSWCRQLRAL